jgi:hypothetical protein
MLEVSGYRLEFRRPWLLGLVQNAGFVTTFAWHSLLDMRRATLAKLYTALTGWGSSSTSYPAGMVISNVSVSREDALSHHRQRRAQHRRPQAYQPIDNRLPLLA